MSRRLLALLGLVVLAALAGCSAPGSISLEPVTDADLAAEASRPMPPAEAEGPHSVIYGAVENGSATIDGTSEPVDSEGPPVEVDGAYYRLSTEVVDRHTETSVRVEVDYNGSVDGSAVDYDDLSEADRELLGGLFPPDTGHLTDGYDKGSVGRYDASEADDSALLTGDYAAVRYEGERYPIRLHTREIDVQTYRYTVEEVAPDATSYAESLREQYAFTLSGLSEAERSVVEEATEGSYYAENDDDEAFRSVLERFRAHEAFHEEEYRGEWIVRYRGTVYWAELDYSEYRE